MIEEIITKYKLQFTLQKNLYQRLEAIDFNKHQDYKKLVQKVNNIEDKAYNLYKVTLKNKLLYQTSYRNKDRNINLYTKKPLKNDNYITVIDRILNFFNNMPDSRRLILIDIFLDDNPKILKNNQPLDRNVINGASVIKRKKWLVIFKKSEWIKTLIHELIHYHNYHIYNFKSDLFYVYQDIKTSSNLSFNEAYTEFFALIIYYFLFYKKDIDKLITRELAWGFIQSAKLLKYKDFSSYQELFNEKEYQQDGFFLSYYIGKTYLLYKKYYQNCICLGINDKLECFFEKKIDLQDKKFTAIINYCLKNLDPKDKNFNFSLT